MDFSNRIIYLDPIDRCPLCESRDIRFLFFINRYNPPFKTDKCAECGFIFMNPQFNEDFITGLYGKDYYKGTAGYSYYDERDVERYSRYVWEKRIKKIRSFIDGGRFLDIGCSFGGFLKTASEFFDPYGIEISEYAGGYAKRELGGSIHIGTMENHPFQHNMFSVITMIEVLEHMPEPAGTIAECCGLLRKGGLLVIQTANMDGLQAKILGKGYAYFMPGHLSYFSKKNINDVLKKSGFEKIIFFHPVEFGLIPKLLKSRYTFRTFLDYRKWIRIALYHFFSKIRFRNFACTSSMVVYAFK